MADIRIKDLSSASSSASDDFIAIDGTTNGTRKLNAFSPTFGGDATVTGTLTVNGTGLSQMVGNANTRLEVGNASADQRAHIGLVQRLNLGNPIFSKNLAGQSGSDSYTTISTTPASGYSGIEVGYGGVIKLLNGTGATTADAVVTPTISLDTNTTRVNIPLTTASTTTSTGALVVSGGVGVGGAINAGGTITSVNGSGSGLLGMRSSSGNASYVFWSETGVADRGILGFNNGSSTLSYRSFSSSFSTGTEVFSITSAGVVSIPATTASTSTSSGALVVSGGVGVAGAIYAANLGGTSTNNNAASGCIGEYASATTAYASKVSLTSNTAANIVSISLTAGDWDVQFNPVFTQDTSLTTSGVLAGVSSSSGVLPSGAAERAHSPSGPNGNSDLSIAPPVTRISLASTTTIYGVATGIFSAGTMSAYGFIRARRVR